MQEQRCHCGAAAAFEDCCGPLLRGERVAETAEQLMRSRYSAYVIGDDAYLRATWHPETRPSRVRFTAGLRWLGLKICACEAGLAVDDQGMVEFVARAKEGGRASRLHERSAFSKVDGRWYYLRGQHL